MRADSVYCPVLQQKVGVAMGEQGQVTRVVCAFYRDGNCMEKFSDSVQQRGYVASFLRMWLDRKLDKLAYFRKDGTNMVKCVLDN